ncbi:MAG: response regulator [Elusimicrobia bacterium]|nr:response regulator [Elusimicrobiota bacterium]
MATILCIEDDVDLQDVVNIALKGYGYNVERAFTGEDGYEKAVSLKPELILLDMMLPTLNGLEVLKMLKDHETARRIPVVVVSAFYGEGPFTHESITKLGAAASLQKPVRFDELAAVIAHALAQVNGASSIPAAPAR